ncbi:MAG: phosphatase PAP2 family protein [Flavisolibacter sp.]
MKTIAYPDILIRNKTLEHFPFFSTHLDNFLKWTPLAAVFVLDLFKVSMRHQWKKQVLLGSCSMALLEAAIQPLKKMTHEFRPNLSPDTNSFPSDHTAACFLSAEIFHQELKEHHDVLSYAGYAAAATTGVLRILKNRHWTSDVLCGALLGLATVKVIYAVFKESDAKKRSRETKKLNLSSVNPQSISQMKELS